MPDKVEPFISETEARYMQDYKFQITPENHNTVTVAVVPQLENSEHLDHRYPLSCIS